MRNLASLILALALSGCVDAMSDLAPSESSSAKLLKAKQHAHEAHRVADQLRDLPDNQFLAEYHKLGVENDTITELGFEDGIRRDDIGALSSDINHELIDINNLIKDGFDSNHPRIISMRADIAGKQKQIHKAIEELKRGLIADALAADAQVKILEAGNEPITLHSK